MPRRLHAAACILLAASLATSGWLWLVTIRPALSVRAAERTALALAPFAIVLLGSLLYLLCRLTDDVPEEEPCDDRVTPPTSTLGALPKGPAPAQP